MTWSNWQMAVNPVNGGGTGATTATQARENLGAVSNEFGLGTANAPGAPNDDANQIAVNGIYYVGATTSNAPGGYGILLHLNSHLGTGGQIYTGSWDDLRYRSHTWWNNPPYSPWRIVYDNANFPVETGIWTPIVNIGGVNASWVGQGTWSRQGSNVRISFNCHGIPDGTNGEVQIHGLPFIPQEHTTGAGSALRLRTESNVTSVTASVIPGRNWVFFSTIRQPQEFSYTRFPLLGEDLFIWIHVYVYGAIEYTI